MGFFDFFNREPVKMVTDVTFAVGGMEDPVSQDLLAELKLRPYSTAPDAVIGIRTEDDGRVLITVDGRTVGRLDDDVQTFLSENSDRLQRMKRAEIRGGAATYEGEVRPYMLVITAVFDPPVPEPLFTVPALLPAGTFFDHPADKVVLVSDTGKIHDPEQEKCNANPRRCRPMLLQDAALSGQWKLCSKCFHDDT